MIKKTGWSRLRGLIMEKKTELSNNEEHIFPTVIPQ
jgi:hypothetical protein